MRVVVSRASNKELHKANEELCRDLQQLGEGSTGERGPTIQARARPRPFSQVIMDVVVPASFITPKIVFTGTEDPEAHLTTFKLRWWSREERMLFIASCSWVRSLAQHYNGLLASQTATSPLSISFLDCSGKQFIVNQAQSHVPFDLFGVKQRQENLWRISWTGLGSS